MYKTEEVRALMRACDEYDFVAVLYHYFGKSIRIRIGLSESNCRLSIDELMLSVRSHNALRRANIMTLGDLLNRLNEGSVRSIRNLGAKSYSEIQTKMLVYTFDHLTDNEKAEFFYYLTENNVKC